MEERVNTQKENFSDGGMHKSLNAYLAWTRVAEVIRR